MTGLFLSSTSVPVLLEDGTGVVDEVDLYSETPVSLSAKATRRVALQPCGSRRCRTIRLYEPVGQNRLRGEATLESRSTD